MLIVLSLTSKANQTLNTRVCKKSLQITTTFEWLSQQDSIKHYNPFFHGELRDPKEPHIFLHSKKLPPTSDICEKKMPILGGRSAIKEYSSNLYNPCVASVPRKSLRHYVKLFVEEISELFTFEIVTRMNGLRQGTGLEKYSSFSSPTDKLCAMIVITVEKCILRKKVRRCDKLFAYVSFSTVELLRKFLAKEVIGNFSSRDHRLWSNYMQNIVKAI